jgi:cadmium resistance protein CadD (predicted permease)
LEVAAVTFANGGDNIGVYVPVFATAGVDGISVLSRWGHILLPLVLIAIGLLILIEGGAFGL